MRSGPRFNHLVWLLACLIALVPGAPAQAASLPLTRLMLTSSTGQALTLCLPVGATGDPQLLEAGSVAGLFGVVRSLGGGVCQSAPEAAFALPAAQPAPNQAGLVIAYGDGRVVTFCIDLGDDGQMSGEALLLASNLPVIIDYSGVGGAVCKIGDVGSNFPSEACFARCTLRPGEACLYWSYSRRNGDAWRPSAIGAGSRTVQAGEVDGWAWGEGSGGAGALPPAAPEYTFAAICGTGANPAPSPVPPENTATFTPLPSETLAPVEPSATATSMPDTATATALPSTHIPTETPQPSPPPSPTQTVTAPVATSTPDAPVAVAPTETSPPVVQPTASTGSLPAATPSPVAQAAPASSPASSYLAFGVIALFVVVCWVILGRRREKP